MRFEILTKLKLVFLEKIGQNGEKIKILWNSNHLCHVLQILQAWNAIEHYPSPFVFSLSDPKQNARSFLTPVSGTVSYALSHGSLGFALHGSFFNHLLIG